MTSYTARYFVGNTARPLHVAVWLDQNESLMIEPAQGEHPLQSWPLGDLRALEDHARSDQMVLTRHQAGAIDSAEISQDRLIIQDQAFMAALRSTCPNLTKRDVKAGTWRKVALYFAGAIGAVVLMLFVIIPALANSLAQIIPIEREVAYGKSIVRQIERLFGGDGQGGLICSTPQGDAALDKMLARLTENSTLEYALNVRVMKHEMINAFAAPGGQIVIVDGLLQQARSAEEVAAVLGHEIGHVEARDTTRGALRATGSAGLLSMVFGDFVGGTLMVAVAEYVMNASYTREAEALADEYAFAMLDSSYVSLHGMAEFFEALDEGEGGILELPVYFSSHPISFDRAARARKFAKAQQKVSPILSDQEWRDLKEICSEVP